MLLNVHEQKPQTAEAFAAGSAEALSHRFDRLPGRHGLGRVRAVEPDYRPHAGVEDHPIRYEHEGPDEPHCGCRLSPGWGPGLQARVECQRQNGQNDADLT
jgi:hypothetical protein